MPSAFQRIQHLVIQRSKIRIFPETFWIIIFDSGYQSVAEFYPHHLEPTGHHTGAASVHTKNKDQALLRLVHQLQVKLFEVKDILLMILSCSAYQCRWKRKFEYIIRT